MANKPIFFDASGRRAGRVSLIGWIAAVIGTIVTASLIASIVSIAASPLLPFGHLTAIHLPELERKAQAPGLLKSAEKLALEARARREELSIERKRRTERGLRELSAQLLPQPGRALSIGFYSPTWGQESFSALKRTLAHVDWVLPIWLPLQGPDLTLNPKFDPRLADVSDYIRRNKPSAAILPVVQNITLGKWDGPGLAALLADEKRRTALVGEIADFVIQHRFQGAVIDFEQMPKSGYGDLATFLKQLSASLGPHGLIVAVAAPFDDESWPFAAFAHVSDYTILMAYDEHDDTAPEAGSIAGQSWYEDTLDKRMHVLNPQRTIIALGSYGYDWNSGHADSITFSDAVIAAHDSEAQIDFDDTTNNPHFSYIEDDGTKHDIWFLDGVTAYNEIHAADPYQPAGYALWRIGSEDPSLWSVMGRAYGALPPKGLNDINIGDQIDYEGQGEILRVEAEPSTGTRSVETDPVTGDINDENYIKLPTSYVIRNFGFAPKKIALTFDDGPDPEWTSEILDILKEKHVKATFFVIGANAEANPGLVLRMYDEGHEIGNHTYTHPNLADTPNEMVRIELTATERLFEALTGHSMRFFRPPYLGDAEPEDADEIVPVQIGQDLGYTTVGEHIDPVDWTRPGADKIVSEALKQVHTTNPDKQGSSIILLHDAGGDRSQTVAALPALIDKLRAQGYQFVLVSDLVGLSRNQAMPPISTSVALVNDRVVFLSMSVIGHVLYYAFLVAIWLGIGRLFFLASMSLMNRPKETDQAAPPPDSEPFRVSVIVPAFNEEKVIAKTIAGLLASDYRNLELLVVDDGSADNTSAVVREAFGSDQRVTLIREPNSGKASALNTGLARAQGDVVVALDADTQFNADTISRLVRWFTDPEIGAVAGNAKVGNRINMITRWQALEYVVAQNLERRALAGLGTLTVVPGAVGAWRREALVKLGGFRTDTLAEDQDLTIDIQRQGYRVHFDSSALAWTEAPATFRGLAKQRFRWAYGTLQCLWKYRGLTFNPRYGALGMIALPQVWVFQILLTALAPLADLLLLWQLFWQWVAYLQHGAEFNNTDLVTVGIYYLVFVVVDVIAAIFGFLMEKGEDWSLLWWLPLQRFGYRQLMYYVVVRSISTAIRGPSVGWGKLERTGTVQVRRA